MGLVGLEHVAATERTENGEDREQHRHKPAQRQPAFGKALGDVVHRTTRDMTVGVFIAVFHTQRTFGELCRHAKQARNNHPKGRPRPADADRNRHASDVAQTHGARKRSCQRLKVADLTRVIRIGIITADQLDRVPEALQLDGPEVHGKDQCADNQPQGDPRKIRPRQGREDE